MVAVVVCVAEDCVGFVHGTTRVVAQFCARVRVTPASLHTLSSSWLVFVIWVVFLVLDTEPLSLLHEGTLLTFTQQAAENTAGQGCPQSSRAAKGPGSTGPCTAVGVGLESEGRGTGEGAGEARTPSSG